MGEVLVRQRKAAHVTWKPVAVIFSSTLKLGSIMKYFVSG